MLSAATCRAIDNDPACKAEVLPGTVGGLPTSWSALISMFLPYLQQGFAALLQEAIQALAAEGVSAPDTAQLAAKCHELASCR